MSTNDNHLRQVQWLTTIMAILAAVLLCVLFTLWKPPETNRIGLLIIAAIPEAVVALIAIPIVYFIFTRRGIATHAGPDGALFASLVAEELFRAATARSGGRVCRRLVIVVYHNDWKGGKWLANLFNGMLG